MKVLIIDDEMNICLTLKNILEDEGYECDFALDSKKGMNKFESMIPDIVLLDVRLDGSNGIDLLKDMKKLREDIIVIIGGVIPAQDYEYLYENGASAIFGPGTKIPETTILLLKLIKERLSGKS